MLMLRMGALRQASRDKVYPQGIPYVNASHGRAPSGFARQGIYFALMKNQFLQLSAETGFCQIVSNDSLKVI